MFDLPEPSFPIATYGYFVTVISLTVACVYACVCPEELLR